MLAWFHRWLTAYTPTPLPKSPLAKAFAYTLSNWTALTVFVNDGSLAANNNLSERAMRPWPCRAIILSQLLGKVYYRDRPPVWRAAYSSLHNFGGFQELEDGIAWAIAFPLGLQWRVGIEGAFLHCQVGLDVTMGRDRALMTQPQGDDRDVDASLQQMHGRRVPPGMWRYSVPCQP